MFNRHSLSLIACTLLCSNAALADYTAAQQYRIEPAGTYYMSVLGGFSMFDNLSLEGGSIVGVSGSGTGRVTFNTAYNGALGYGYHFAPANLYIEGQYHYSRAGLKKFSYGTTSGTLSGNTQIHSAWANVKYEMIRIGHNTHPYVGVGLGFNHVRFIPTGIDTSTANRFGYQVIIGMLAHKKENFSLDFSYRAKFISSLSGVKGKMNTQHFAIGFTFDVDNDD